jgi:opacity protein-like surface antigen
MKRLAGMLVLLGMVSGTGVAAAEGWTGWYGGAYGGYIFGKLTSSDPDHFLTTGEFDDNGATAGIQIGRRTQNENNVVMGFELTIPLYTESGTAVDTVYFPGLVTYEGDPKLGALLGVQVGKASGRTLCLLSAAVGFMSAEGKTFIVDENDAYSPGFVQSASATHFVWQLGGGIERQVGTDWLIGARASYLKVAKADHTMSWNEPGPNEFGLNAAQVQFSIGKQF